MSALDRWLRRPWVAALLTGVWMLAATLPSADLLVWLAIAVSVIGVVVSVHHVTVGAAVVCVGSLLCMIGGAPYGELEMLLPTFWVLFWLGKQHGNWLIGIVMILSFTATTALREGATWYAVPTAIAVYSGPWLFGRLVWFRAKVAHAAVAETARLAATDLQRLLHETSETTRRHASGASLSELHRAIADMRDLTTQAESSLTHEHVELIRRRGAEAVSELHRILRYLRAPQSTDTHRITDDRGRSRSPRVTFAILVGLAGLASLVLLIANQQTIPMVIAAVAFPLSLSALQRSELCGAAIGSIALLLVAHEQPMFPEPVAVWFVALLWQLSCRYTTMSRIAMALVVLSALPLGYVNGPLGIAFVIVIVVLTVLAAWWWREYDSIVYAEQERLAKLSAAIASAQMRSEHAARQRLASELHDGVSHGLTAVVVHTQAALTYANIDPLRSRRALKTALDASNQALTEVTHCMNTSSATAAQGRYDLRSLVEGMRVLGVQVTTSYNGAYELPKSVDALTFRIVQESLTNAMRHAPGSDIDITILELPDKHEVRITTQLDPQTGVNTPAGAEKILTAVGVSTGLRSGLAGLTDRVKELQGHFVAQPVNTEFLVHASWKPLSQRCVGASRNVKEVFPG